MPRTHGVRGAKRKEASESAGRVKRVGGRAATRHQLFDTEEQSAPGNDGISNGLRFAFATFYNDWVQFRRKYRRNITETKGDDMLFMAIFSYSPEDRNLVIERGLGAEKSAGINVIGEWFDISGHRVFRLFEAEDDTHLASSVFGWSDLGVAEVIPVMETEKALKLLKKSGKKC